MRYNVIISIANSDDSDDLSLLFSLPLDRRYQIQFYSTDSFEFGLHPTH